MSKPVDNALAFLLEHLPPQMHLVIATREDPHLPLARLRARGQLTELRAADLRFTPAEAAEFLNQVMGLNLSAEDIAALEARTEGWIAGLQLAALALQGSLSMQGHPDTSRFIQSFTGSHRFVLDYLVEEVLQRQPEHIRSLLLQTAILERLSGPLCDAVTGQGGSGILETLERGNLFIVPLDDQRQWYRYHHLFTEVLLAHALEEQPGQIPLLHKRASVWYEQNNLPAEAIRHALAARDFERAAGLIEKTYPAMDSSFQSATWLGWVRKLPDEVVRARPVLSVDYARALSDSGEFDASMSWLQDAEQRLEGSAEGMVVADETQFRTLPAMIALARSYHTQVQGDIEGTVKYAELALELSPEEDHYIHTHAMAIVTVGMAYWIARRSGWRSKGIICLDELLSEGGQHHFCHRHRRRTWQKSSLFKGDCAKQKEPTSSQFSLPQRMIPICTPRSCQFIFGVGLAVSRAGRSAIRRPVLAQKRGIG